MPKADKKGHAKKDELPSTLQRSDRHAQATFAQTYDAALKEYGDAERAARTAYASLKHSYEKVGDHWQAKARPGPSENQTSSRPGLDRPTSSGVDANASKEHLYQLAKQLKVPGRSTMSKRELVDALQKANDKATRQASRTD